MKLIIVTGSQWGDEGKGKLVYFLTKYADIVVRYAGGNNAGHKIQLVSKKHVTLSALPGGILFPQKINILATGYLLNLSATVAEINHLKKRGFFKGELLISNRAHLIMPYHLQLDYCQEEQKSLQAIGTTKKGISPCMQDKMGRMGLRFGDLVDSNFFASRLTQVVNQKNQQLSILTKKNKTYAFQTLFQETMTLYQKIAHFGCNLLHWWLKSENDSRTVLLEGAQGTLLDIDVGTYPYVTASYPRGTAAIMHAEIPPQLIDKIVHIGVCKMYTSRVGAGVLVTTMKDPNIKQHIVQTGHEFGSVTGRPRRVGWLDLVALRHSCLLNNFQYWATMLLDVLTGLPFIKVCISYQLQKQEILYLPTNIKLLSQCKPRYVILPGWKDNISHFRDITDLPVNAKRYLTFISSYTKTPIGLISVGPLLSQIIITDQFQL